MIILAIETTGPLASVAILDDHSIIKENINHTRYSHLEEIVPMLKDMMTSEGLTKDDITAIAVSRGPGSFTGIRIGIATAKALAQVWDKPIVEVPTLKSFVYGEEISKEWVVCPIFDARRSQVYAAAYKREDYGINILIEEGAYELGHFLSLLKDCNHGNAKVAFYGDGTKAYAEQIKLYPGCFIFASEENYFQRASRVALLGSELFHQGIFTNAFRAKPEYLRKSEAERKLLKNE